MGSGGEKEQIKKLSNLLDGSSEFVLTYEDKDGDWMLVGDVPWRYADEFYKKDKRFFITITGDILLPILLALFILKYPCPSNITWILVYVFRNSNFV